MGRGNWMPDNPARWCVQEPDDTFRTQWYVELIPLDQEEYDEFEADLAYEDLLGILREALPKSFDNTDRRQNSDWFGGGFAVDTASVFHNDHVLVCTDTRGELYHYGIGVVVNPDSYARGYGSLAEISAARTAERLEKTLLERYEGRIHVRTSAWTSGPLKAA